MADAYCIGVTVDILYIGHHKKHLTYEAACQSEKVWQWGTSGHISRCVAICHKYLTVTDDGAGTLPTMLFCSLFTVEQVHLFVPHGIIWYLVVFGTMLLLAWYCVDVWYLVMEQSHTSDKLRWWRAVYQLLMVLHHWCNLQYKLLMVLHHWCNFQYQLMCRVVQSTRKVWYCLMWSAVTCLLPWLML